MKLIETVLLGLLLVGLSTNCLANKAYANNHTNVAMAEAREDDDTEPTFFDTHFHKVSYRTPQQIETAGKNLFIFDPQRLRWFAYDQSGILVGSGRASGGRNYCPDIKRRCKTAIGTFHVYRMGGANCESSKYPLGKGGAPMPYCMFFHGGFAIHGSNDLPNRNASHGCIRVDHID
jgi:L,D-transpeptidase catalytic domain